MTASNQATLVAIPRNHLEQLEAVLKAAQLRPLSFGLGISALQDPERESSNGVIALVPGENAVDLQVRNADGEVYFELRMSDAWVWDMYRPARFVKNVRVVTFKDVNVEELEKPDLEVPEA